MMLRFIGIGDEFNYELNNTVAFFEDGDNLVFIDAGKGLTDFLMENKLENADKFNSLEKFTFMITHMHPEAVCELGLTISYLYNDIKKPVELFGPSDELIIYLKSMGISEEMYKIVGNGSLHGNTFIAHKVKTKHTKNTKCYGYIVYFSDGGGFYYSGHTKEFNESMLELLAGGHIDNIYHEVWPSAEELKISVKEELKKYNSNLVHTPYSVISSKVPEKLKEKIVLMNFNCKSNKIKYILDGFDTADETTYL